MTKTINQLEEIMRTELDLAQALFSVLEEEEQAIVRLQIESLDKLVAREHELLKPIQDLEKERNKLVNALASQAQISHGPRRDSTVPLRELLGCLDTEDARRISTMGTTLREETEKILTINRRIKILLSQSLRFVRESVGILTENYSKQLIDERV